MQKSFVNSLFIASSIVSSLTYAQDRLQADNFKVDRNMSLHESGSEPDNSNAKDQGIAGGEARVLPEGISRFRVVHTYAHGESGFDSKGKKNDLGLKLNAAGGGLVAEHGLTSKLSFRLLAPFVYRNEVSVNEDKFKRSQPFQAKYKQMISSMALELQALGVCANASICIEMIEQGLEANAAREISLPSGEKNQMEAGEKLRDYAERTILAAGKPPHKGQTGLGDIELGLLYNFRQTDSLGVAGGFGLRLATGKYDAPELTRPTGAGTNDLGLRVNVDYSPCQGVWFAAQAQSEIALNTRSWRRPSMTDNTQFSEGDASQIPPGDGLENERTFRQVGWMTSVLAKVNVDLGILEPSFKAVSLNTSYELRHDRAKELNGVESEARSRADHVTVGALASGLPYQLPLEFEASYTIPVAGESLKIAPKVLVTALRFYGSF